jgi:conjugative relaxase-like TrwC/TraI family protein
LEYYEAQVAAGAEDYYAGRGESPGQWRGTDAHRLGLKRGGRVERKQFMALMQGRHPLTGEVLRAMGMRSTVPGLDLTFSAPKSVSVLFAITEGAVSAALLAAHEAAVDAALAYMDREACVTRRGAGRGRALARGGVHRRRLPAPDVARRGSPAAHPRGDRQPDVCGGPLYGA